MRMSVAVAIFGAAALLAPAFSAQAAQPASSDYLEQIKTIASTAAAPPAQPGCENGEERDDSGACPVVDDSDAKSRGFTLFSGSMNKPQGAAAPTPTAKVVVQARPARPAADSFSCGQSCDLKVTFKTGSAVLTPDSELTLVRFATTLRDGSLSHRRYEIAGYTDASGSPEKNRSLSQARAEAVKAFLVAHGVPPSRLEAKGYGAEGLIEPRAPLDPRNRRVEARALN